MKYIHLRPSGVSKVDDDDFEFLRHFIWRKNMTTGYAYRTIGIRRTQKILYLHRFIMEPCDPFQVDHKNHDKLDNRKKNLRLVTSHENTWNRFSPCKKYSKYFGVTYIKEDKAWRAFFGTREKRHINLGRYDTEIEAAVAYDMASKNYWGEGARLNFPKGPPIPPPIPRSRNKQSLGLHLFDEKRPGMRATIRVIGGSFEERLKMADDIRSSWRKFNC